MQYSSETVVYVQWKDICSNHYFCSAKSVGENVAQHSDRLHSLFMNIPGLKIICPSTSQDMYSMLKSALLDNNLVLCFADRPLLGREQEVDYKLLVPIGRVILVKAGKNLTLVSKSDCYKFVDEIVEGYGDDVSIG